MRRTVSNSLMITALFVGVAATDTSAKETSKQAPTAQAEKKLPTASYDPKAIAALQRMGAYLQTQQSFAVHTSSYTDYVLESGQKIREAKESDLLVRRPNKVRANVVSDTKERQFFYDGKTFTLYSPKVGYYATVNALPTIRQVADLLEERYGLQLPVVDLFRFGTADDPSGEITGAIYVGPTRVNGIDADQYAFRQPGLDWQIWIQKGDQPLPLKMLLTTTDDKALPEHQIAMTWTLGAKFNDSVFAFVPPRDATKITFKEAEVPPIDQPKQQARRPTPSTRSTQP